MNHDEQHQENRQRNTFCDSVEEGEKAVRGIMMKRVGQLRLTRERQSSLFGNISDIEDRNESGTGAGGGKALKDQMKWRKLQTLLVLEVVSCSEAS